MLIGEYRHNLDNKGRVIIPSKLRESLGQTFVLTTGLDECIAVYPLSEWENISEKFDSLAYHKGKNRDAQRLFYLNASYGAYDKQGRLLLPQALRNHANIEEEVVIVGLSKRLELWDATKWDNYINEKSRNPEALFEDLEQMV